MNVKPRFDGLIFDNGDILFDASVWRRWLLGQLNSIGVSIEFSELIQRWESKLVEVYCGRADYWKRFEELLTELRVNEKQVHEMVAASRAKSVEVQSERRHFPHVPETLSKLRMLGVRLAVLSDSEVGESGVRRILQQLGIDQFFDGVLVSSDIGHAKPDPRAYMKAVTSLSLSPIRCAFVGHDCDELEGAQKAGLFAIAFNYDQEASADVYVDHFSDLVDVVCPLASA